MADKVPSMPLASSSDDAARAQLKLFLQHRMAQLRQAKETQATVEHEGVARSQEASTTLNHEDILPKQEAHATVNHAGIPPDQKSHSTVNSEEISQNQEASTAVSHEAILLDQEPHNIADHEETLSPQKTHPTVKSEGSSPNREAWDQEAHTTVYHEGKGTSQGLGSTNEILQQSGSDAIETGSDQAPRADYISQSQQLGLDQIPEAQIDHVSTQSATKVIDGSTTDEHGLPFEKSPTGSGASMTDITMANSQYDAPSVKKEPAEQDIVTAGVTMSDTCENPFVKNEPCQENECTRIFNDNGCFIKKEPVDHFASRKDLRKGEPRASDLTLREIIPEENPQVQKPLIKSEEVLIPTFQSSPAAFARPRDAQDAAFHDASSLFPEIKEDPQEKSAPPRMPDIVISNNADNEVIPLSDHEDVEMFELSDDSDSSDDIEMGTAEDFLAAEQGKTTKEPSSSVKKPEKPKKQRRPQVKTAAEAHLRSQQDRENKRQEREKKQQDRRAKKEALGSKPQGIKKTAKKSKKNEKRLASGLLQFLMKNKSPAEQGAEDDEDPLPSIIASVKETQLDLLLAMCPNGTDMHKARRNKADLKRASRRFGRGQITASNGRWLLKGMQTAFLNHQLIAVDFMLEREFANDGQFQNGPSGGLLCDAMGLGKTVDVLGTMVANYPDKTVPEGRRGTLVVVPASVIWQWRKEIQEHCDPEMFPDVMIYQEAQAKKMKMSVGTISFQSIVLTTYEQLLRSCPFPDAIFLRETKREARERRKFSPKMDKSTENMLIQDDVNCKIEAWIEDNRESGGPLHQIQWHRVVLDEGHFIKNHTSRRSQAANALKAKCRWVVTGTPVMNEIEELYAYFRFLKDSGTTSYLKFQKEFCNYADENCRIALEAKLSGVMIRRTMNDKLLGKRLIQLPKSHEDVFAVEQCTAERVLYQAVEERFREMLNKRYHDKDPRTRYASHLPQITRLRQLTAHPLLIERTIKTIFSIKQLKKIQSTLHELHVKNPNVDMTIHDQMTIWMGEKKMHDVHGALDLEEPEAICGICQDECNDDDDLPMKIKKCGHVFCGSCIQKRFYLNVGETDGDPKCPTCGEEFDLTKLVPHEIEYPDEEVEQTGSGAENIKGKDSRGFRPTGMKLSPWLDRADDGEVILFQSAKMKALKTQLEQWSREAPTEKIIIFTQWRTFCTIIGRMLSDLEIGFVYFTGDMSPQRRDAAVHEFEEKADNRVLVSGLKCGGFGLNLAFANRVILVDLWWNCSVENQALGRVYRLRQKLETYFVKTVVTKTVDERIFTMQQRKMEVIDHTLQDSRDGITPEEMASLIGRVEKDENGKYEIVADYDDDDAGIGLGGSEEA